MNTTDPDSRNPPVTLATVVAWRRFQEACSEDVPPADDAGHVNGHALLEHAHAAGPDGEADRRNGTRTNGHVALNGSANSVDREFAERQQAALKAMISFARLAEPSTQPPPAVKADTAQSVPAAPPPDTSYATTTRPPDVISSGPVIIHPTLRSFAIAAPTSPEPGLVVLAPENRKSAATRKSHKFWRMPGLWLVAILTAQAALSVRLITAYTAFNDEALYLWAGRLEWSHWLHGTSIPEFQTYFSGAPVIYPPIGALANDVGGLVAARLLSLAFMLGATALLWGTASRLFDWRVASFAASFWAILGPTQHLGAYATYDAMAVFLTTLAAWCATGRRDKNDSTGWILAAAGALALANATKYATAIFDPVVIALAVVSAWPTPGGKVALRRGTLLTTCTAGALALLLRLGGPLYLRGIEQTTLERTGNTAPMLTVLDQSWAWVGSIAVVAILGTLLSWRRPTTVLLALLAAAVLLVPMEQARIHTVTSLNKHVDFGAWFAAIAAGYAIGRLVALSKLRIVRVIVSCACILGFFFVSLAGELQAREMLFGYWPNEARLMAALRPLTAHGGAFLAEGQYVPEYYLHDTNWQDWSNTRSVNLPDGQIVSVSVGGQGNPAIYRRLIAEHYFSVVLLTFTDTVSLDVDIAKDLQGTPGYYVFDRIPFGSTRRGDYTIWVYRPDVRKHLR